MHTTGLAKAELAKAEQAQIEQNKAVLAQSKQAKTEKVKAELDKAEHVQAGIAEAELAKAELAKAEQAKLEQDKAEQVQADIAEAELATAVLAKAEQAKSELAQAKHAKVEQARAELEKAEKATTELAKAEQAKAEQVKPEIAKAELAKAEQAKSVSARADKAKVELPKAEQNKAEQAKAEIAKVELAKAQTEQAKADLAKAKLAKAKLAKAQAEQSKAEKVKSELAKTELAKAEKDKEELAKTQGEQAKAELAKAELAKAELVKSELAKAELAKTEQAKAETAKAELVKAELVKAELAKAELAKAELAKKEQAKAETAKAELANAELAKAKNDEPAQYSSWSASEDRYGINDILTTRDYEQVKRERLRERKHTVNEAVSAADDKLTNLNISAKAENKTLQQKDVSPTSRYERVDRGVDDYNRLREKYGFSHAVSAKENKQPSKDVAATDDSKKTQNNAPATNKHERGNEGQWVYSESSKQFKLASQIERKTKPADHTVAMMKDVHPSSFRALSLKEKGQTKQEILTSKLKAHAEKEISAIKEKGFGKRDRLLSRNPTKHQEQRERGQNGQEVTSVKNDPSRVEKQTNSQLSDRKEAPQSEHKEPAKTEASAVSDGQQSRASLEQAINRSKVSDVIEKEVHQSKREESANEAISGDSLQIMGIMVTIREPSVNEDNVFTPHHPTPVKDKINMEKEAIISNRNELSSGQLPSNNSGHLKQETPPAMAPIADERVSENAVKSIVTSKREDTTFAEPVITEKTRVKQQTQLPEGKGEPKTECVMSGSKQARSAPETTKKNPEKNDKSVRNENYSREIPKSYGRDQSQRETLLHDTSAVKDGRSAEVKSAKNKQLAETQPLLFKHSITARNPNDYANNNHPSNESIGKADLAAVEMEKSSVIQGGKDISVQDGQVENLHIGSITVHVVSLISEIDNHKTTEGHSVTEQVSSGAEKPTGDNNVHIDSIAIRVVSGVSENDNVETTAREGEHNPALPSEKVSQKSEVKPRQKALPTVPTAIADYARLKVISTEEDSPPNVDSPSRKDGYFPMIQTHRSRCPVFTVEQQDHPVTGGVSRKEEVSVKGPEIPSKLNTEAKIGVLSSMEPEQRKKGTIKLREKEKQPISFNEAKTTEGFTETHSLKHDTVPQPEHATTSGYQLGYQSGIDWNQRLYQSQNPPLPARAIPSQVDVKTRNPSFSQQPTQPTHVDMPGKDPFSPTEATQYMEKTHATQASLGDIYSTEKREERRERQREEQRKEEERKTRQREDERMVRNKEERKEEERKVRWRDEERMVIARQKEDERKEEERREQQRLREEKKAEERRKRQREEEKMARQREEEKKEKERREQQCRREEENKEEEERARQKEEEKNEKERREQQRQREEEKKEEEMRARQREEDRMARQKEEEKNEKERREQQRQREEKKEEERRARQRESERMARQKEEKERREQQRQREEEKKEEERRARRREEERMARQKEEEKERREQQRQREEEKKEEERRARRREEERMARQKEEEKNEKERREQQRQRDEEKKEEERREQQRQREEEKVVRQKEEEKDRIEQQRQTEEKKEEERVVRQKEEEKDRIEQQRQKEEKKEEERRVRQIEEERKEEMRRERQREEERIARQKEEDLKEEERRAQQRKKEERARQREGERMVRQKEEERKEEERKEERMARQKEEKRKEERMARQKEEERKEERMARQKEEERKEERMVRQKEEERKEERMVRQKEEEKKGERIGKQRQIDGMNEGEMRARQIEEDITNQQRQRDEKKEERKARQREEETMARQKEEERREEQQRREEEKKEEEWMVKQKEEERKEEARKEERREQRRQRDEEKMARQKEKERKEKERKEKERRDPQRQREEEKTEEKQRARQREKEKMDALQYYSISSPEGQTRPRDIPLFSPQPSPRRGDLEDWESYGRPHLPTSPAPPSTRSNTSSPALGGKPTMFRVKDNTFRGSSLTKSVKPLFHKSFGEEFRVGSALWSGSDMGDEELERTGESINERLRESAGTPVYHDSAISSHRLHRIRETQPSKEFTAPSETTYTHPYSRLLSRRNVALDDDDSRSMISNMSGDVESYATSVADLSDSEFASRGGYGRPDSACSFISDVGRPLGKPPTVPPKSEKALRRAKRLTTRRIKKESKTETDSTADLVEKPVHAVASVPSSPSELRSSNHHARASPHFAAPISLPLAPTHISSVPCSPTDVGSAHHPSFHASPHAKAPASLPLASPHASPPVSHPRVTMQVASVPSSPTHHHHAPPRHLVSPLASPLTSHLNVPQYHVDPYYPSPPSLKLPQHFTQGLTQKKVLQDPGSGQYFVVDMPVQVKTKTFFDPETRKYVQLNVRQPGQGGSLSQPQPQCYPQSLPEDSYTQPQPQTYPPYTQPQAPPASRPYVLYQGYPQRYQPMPVSSLPTHRSLSGMSALVSPTLDPQPTEESQGWAEEGERHGEGWSSQCYEGEEEIIGRETYGQSYSQEQTPYMDTAHDTHTVHDTHAAYVTHNQLDKGAVDGDDTNSAPHRDIITMSELEDFAMDSGDW